MQRQKDESARDASRDLAVLLGQWRDEAAARLKRLQTQDLATLQAQQAALEKNLKNIALPLQKLMGDAPSARRARRAKTSSKAWKKTSGASAS